MVTYTLTKIAIADSSSLCRFLEHCMWSNHKGRQNQQNKTHVVTSHLISQFQMQDSWKSRKASQMFTTAVKYPGIVTRSLAAKSLFPNHKKYTDWSSRCCFICYRTVSCALLCKIIRHTRQGQVWNQHSFFRTEMEKVRTEKKTIACTTTLPGACWFGGGSWHRSRSSCWGWRWPAWTWCRTSLWGIGDRALTRGWSCWLWTIFARWWWRATPCLSASIRGQRASFRVDGGGGSCPRAWLSCLWWCRRWCQCRFPLSQWWARSPPHHMISIYLQQLSLISDLLIVCIFQSGYLNHPLIRYYTESFWTKIATLSHGISSRGILWGNAKASVWCIRQLSNLSPRKQNTT